MALRQLRDDEDHYRGTVSPTYAASAWRHLAANVGSRNLPPAEAVHVIEAFAQDCRDEGWSEYTLDRAVIAWRRSSERFMPTFGQLRACVNDARQKGGPTQYREMLEMLEKRCGKAKPIEGPIGMSRDELLARINHMKIERSQGYKIKPGGAQSDWHILDEKLLGALESKLKNMESSS